MLILSTGWKPRLCRATKGCVCFRLRRSVWQLSPDLQGPWLSAPGAVSDPSWQHLALLEPRLCSEAELQTWTSHSHAGVGGQLLSFCLWQMSGAQMLLLLLGKPHGLLGQGIGACLVSSLIYRCVLHPCHTGTEFWRHWSLIILSPLKPMWTFFRDKNDILFILEVFGVLSTSWSGFPGGSAVKNPPAMQKMQETWVRSLGREDPLEEGMATHSSILVWRVPWTEEPAGLQFMALQRVGHDWSDWAHMQVNMMLTLMLITLDTRGDRWDLCTDPKSHLCSVVGREGIPH